MLVAVLAIALLLVDLPKKSATLRQPIVLILQLLLLQRLLRLLALELVVTQKEFASRTLRRVVA